MGGPRPGFIALRGGLESARRHRGGWGRGGVFAQAVLTNTYRGGSRSPHGVAERQTRKNTPQYVRERCDGSNKLRLVRMI